ncbi:ribonucleotide reductase N-terminal alpha domain-containing protein [Oceanobacillus sojae]|uniref:ribonucleotide reductase N-terminal alpha domain-containing protein n=1 Tax=Oceanobacillus sojae TaxID=582851 RepID=UPI0009885F9C|nr:ribonucleotide reductase N-terminal alpha domain-containing protein [Oceanobacillus sojae]
MTRDDSGTLRFDKDKEAVRAYFVDHINDNMKWFHSLEEKLSYLISENYYDKKLTDKYEMDDIKKVYKYAYSFEFRFPSYMSAKKFYENYALKTNDKKLYLERYEDRISIVALYFGDGDFHKALEFVELLITQQYQPATPTFLNVGKARRGEFVSCFLLECGDSLNDINMMNSTARQLSKRGGGISINLSKTRAKGESLMGYENVTSGVVPIMRNLDQSFRHINQAGQRNGSGSVYINVFHADIYDFLDTKKISADEDVRVKTLSIGVVIPDKMIELARENKPMYLFYPHNLRQVTGKYLDEIDFDSEYEDLLNNPKIRKERIDPRNLLERISIVQLESGYPYIMFEGNVNRAHPLNNLGKVTFSNLCVTGDTKLLTDNGYETAETLFHSGIPLKVVIDDRTKGMDLEDEGTTLVDAIPMQLTKQQADVFKLETRQGFEIRATEWHKFYVKRSGELLKIPLAEIKEGDRVLVQSGEGSYGTSHNPELAYLMGIIAGDGTFTDKAVKIYLYDNKVGLRSRVEKAISSVISSYAIQRKYKHNTSFSPTFTEYQGRLSLSSTVLFDILADYGFHKGNKTDVPKFIEEADKETQAAYLSGYYQMDGTVNANFASKALTVELSSTNREGLRGIQTLLLNMGVYSTIYNGRGKSLTLMPDGKGGEKPYEVNPIYKLSVQDRVSREIFVDVIELKEYDMKKFVLLTDTLQPKSRRPKHQFSAEVSAITYEGKEDVFDTNQPDYHSLIFNGIVTGNCSEILQYSEVSEYSDYGQEDILGQDISCNLGSLNIVSVMEKGDIKGAVFGAMDALTRISDDSAIANAPAVRKANEEMHSVGLGAMNLHGFLAQNGISYESEEAIEFADVFFSALNYYSLVRSNEIAMERGSTFKGFEGSTYQTGEYFDQYVEESIKPEFPKLIEIFEGIELPTREDWAELRESVMENGLYHSYRLAIAPTGSISYVQSATASVMPIMERIEDRTYGDSQTYYPMPGLSQYTWFLYKEAYDMSMYKVIDLIATIQRHVDQGISFTLFVNDSITTRELTRIQLYAHHKGIKTLYYVRQKDTSNEECVSCTV